MTIRIGVNGFGRIGRMVVRAKLGNSKYDNIELVGINDLGAKDTMVHLLKYDSVALRLKQEVHATPEGISIDGKNIPILSQRNPADLPWGKMGVDYVVESTGFFTKRDAAEGHIKGGAKRVVISAPATGDVKTIVMGVNENEYDPKAHTVLSNASCTTNCLAPFAKVILDKFGIKRGLMTTVHAYTNDQSILDFPHSDLRRARAAAVNMIPTKTGAAAAIGLVIPALKGKFDGGAVRVPTPNVSIVDAVMEVEKSTSVEEVNAALKAATNQYLGYTDEPLVSIDFQGDPRSSIVDGGCTKVIGGLSVKVMSWYDNEWGYSNRVLDLIQHIASQEK
ncbi:MAG: type I glyceraldehyde-3-phosphate dehydrogenase [Magnetococcales bacterium]|nr:type I glyceraldehyde-3-phosphate dehydrogenase [Magnetococcales bacterium]MBF0156012.1 type I glyceraldehyde-3-phosphate dehydrogenase [Magnetococcales bacterium]